MGCSIRTTISPLPSHTCSPTGRNGRSAVAVGKTVVSSSMIDRVVNKLGRRLVEVPVGFKWFVEGLIDGSLGFGGEESSGATFLRRDGTVWTTDKDGLIPNLLAAEITARTGKDPGEHYQELTGRVRHTILHAHRRASDTGAEGEAGKTVARGGGDRQARRRADHSKLTRPQVTARRSAASRWWPTTAGSRPGPRARRTSTRSMRRASKIRRTWTRSSAKLKRS